MSKSTNTMGIPDDQIIWKVTGLVTRKNVDDFWNQYPGNPAVAQMWRERRENKQTCDICGKMFANLSAHNKVHDKEFGDEL